MFGEKALELIKQLKRARDGTLPPFDEDVIRQALEEMRVLFEENSKEVNAAVDGEQGLFSGVQLRHASLERNKRCILAYIYHRMMKIRNFRWDVGSVLPNNIKLNLCEQETQWFNKYNKSIANYMKSIGGIGFDLTQHLKPPKMLYIEVRCLTDYGEFETDDGTVILLKKNSQHFLPRSQCEHLIRQGILQHLI
ncbi:DNA replication complex GINS protein PSF1-like [Rhopilema esculentum]|uniref:DNA replication complex GINS protein PSF1-like n=1 Tax=Rhopilema esculentum TaxID=499914 RepID=UPI0031DB1A15